MAPVVSETPAAFIKKQRSMKTHADKWVWNAFTNPAREDGWKFKHWMKESEQDEVYPFARFNRKVEVIKYTDEEYQQVIAPLSTDWSKRETDHLFHLCEKFSLRFIVIADRFEQFLDDEL